MTQSDLPYYERRLAEEVALMEQADHCEVQAVHRKLAELYRQRIVQLANGGQASP